MPAYDFVTIHKGNMAFESHIDGHAVIMDTSAAGGGEDLGPSPKRLLLGTLATCTGMDVVSLLRKMRVDFSDFEIVTQADLTEEHPKVFTQVTVIYRIKVAEEHREKVEKAVSLSQEKYCGISEMLRRNSPLHFFIEFAGR